MIHDIDIMMLERIVSSLPSFHEQFAIAPVLLAGIISAAGALGSSIFSSLSGRSQSLKDAWMKRQWQLDDSNREREWFLEDRAHSEDLSGAMDRAAGAGINPYMAVGNLAAAPQAATPMNPSPPAMNSDIETGTRMSEALSSSVGNLSSAIKDAVSAGSLVKSLPHDIANTDADTSLKGSQKVNTDQDTKNKEEEMKKVEADRLLVNEQNFAQQYQNLLFRETYQNQLKLSDMSVSAAQMQLDSQMRAIILQDLAISYQSFYNREMQPKELVKLDNSIREIKQHIVLMKQQGRMTEEQAKLYAQESLKVACERDGIKINNVITRATAGAIIETTNWNAGDAENRYRLGRNAVKKDKFDTATYPFVKPFKDFRTVFGLGADAASSAAQFLR